MRSSPLRSRYLGLWLVGSAAIHAVVLAGVPVHLPCGRAEAVPLRVCLAPPELLSGDSARHAAAAPQREQERPLERPRLRARAPAPREEERAPSPAPQENAPAERPGEDRESTEPVDLWGEVFAVDSAAGAALDVVEGICAVQVGDPTFPIGDSREAGRSVAGKRDGGSLPGPSAPVGESLTRPRYPRESRRRREEGRVRLRLLVDATGRVGRVALVESSGYERLDEAASRAARGWRFRPARRGERAIAAWVEIPVVFDLREPR